MRRGRTRIQLCGRLEAEFDGVRVEEALPGRQGRLLFAYLVLNRRRGVRRDELVEAVWGEEGPAPSPAALAPPLSRLRKAIGPDRLEGRWELQLILDEEAWIDWEAAHAALRDARVALDAGEAERAADAAGEAAAIAEGGLLPGLEAPWIDRARSELEDLRVEALEVVAAAGLRLGGRDLAHAQRAAQAAVDAAPFRESARAALIEVLRARGNHAEALRAYEELRILLRDELGGTPGPDLMALHADLLRAETAAPASPLPTPAGRPAGGDRPGARLVGRGAELLALDARVRAAATGEGGVAIIDGPAGIGKTSLLGVAREHAVEAGFEVLTARASQLERELAFGVVRQLFEAALADPARRARVMAGAAEPAAAVFDPAVAPADAAASDTSFPVLNGLLWIALGLAAERPLALAVDDLQWADRPSLRFLAYLSRRLEGTPILLVATLRPVPDADHDLLDDIAGDPSSVSVRPRPLSDDAVARLVAERLGAPVDPAFSAACRQTTGGNPLLLGELLAALAADGVTPGPGSAELVFEIGPRAVSRTVLGRLVRLGRPARVVAESVALLGEGADLGAVAALAGLDHDTVAAATAALAGAEILRSEPPLGFAHPLVREAVYRDLPPGQRELRHAAAAAVLRDRGAAPEDVATQLLLAPRRGEAWVSETLEQAAAAALRRGAPESAVAHLARALEEPPPAERRPWVLAALGGAEAMTSGPSATEHLRDAYATLPDPEARARVAHLLARAMIFTGDTAGGAAFARAAAADLPAELIEPRRVLEALIYAGLWMGGEESPLEGLVAYRARPVPDGPGSKALAGVAAVHWAFHGGSAEECGELALEALSGGHLAGSDRVAAGIVLTLADRDEALAAWEGGLADAHRHGSLFEVAGLELWAAFTAYVRGDLADAEESLRGVLETAREWGFAGATVEMAEGFLAFACLARGDVDGARGALARPVPPSGATESARLWRAAHLELLVAEGRDAEALTAAAELRRAHAHSEHPVANPWRLALVTVLARAGRGEEALAEAREALALARRWGAPTGLGRALRTLGLVTGGETGLAHLRESVAALAGSPAKAERARSEAALGAALLRGGRGEEATDALRRALELARACGADGLVAEVRAALPVPVEEPEGVAALTASERRLLDMAAGGLDERAIAQALFLTPRDAALRLRRAREKAGAVEV